VLISRFGGDEFLILIDDLQGARNVIRVSEHLLEALAPAYNVFSSEVHSMASVGIVSGDPISSSSTADEIVRNADVAMYEAKRSGRGCSVVFNAGMHARLTRHVAIETSLRRALGSEELYLEYQPIVDLRSGRRLYVEALARWKHPTMGLISPSEFIPIAEESGLIVAVGQWVLEKACRAMIEWRARDPHNAPAMVSVNLSRAEIALGNRLLEQVQSTLEAVGLPPECLQLEVTEREVMRNPEAARELLGKLRQFGVRLAMDDFGTGTSSLSLLRAYPFNTIKIDRSFLQDLSTSHEVLAVIHATVNLIGNLEMVSLAEGVEDASQVAILRSLGCRYAQGYFFSRPVPAERLLEAMEEDVLPAAGQVRVIQR
jgi:predicted signal transduction protein with EAL and GGDEF domain